MADRAETETAADLYAMLADVPLVNEEDALEQYRVQWETEQLQLKTRLSEADEHGWPEAGPRLIAGVDISFVKASETDACASLVVLEMPSMEVVWEGYERVALQLPYITGYLAFRETPFLMDLLDRLRAERPDLWPDLLMVDGNGVLHPRGFGIASHLGVLADVPAIGVGKNFLHVDGLTSDVVRALSDAAPSPGHAVIVGASGKAWGAAVKPVAGLQKPIYVSVGHRVSLETAVRVVKECSRVRIPEPVRQADLRSREVVRGYFPS